VMILPYLAAVVVAPDMPDITTMMAVWVVPACSIIFLELRPTMPVVAEEEPTAPEQMVVLAVAERGAMVDKVELLGLQIRVAVVVARAVIIRREAATAAPAS